MCKERERISNLEELIPNSREQIAQIEIKFAFAFFENSHVH